MRKFFLFFACVFGICAACKHSDKIKIRTYDVENEVMLQNEIAAYHWDTLRVSLWGNHRFANSAGDSNIFTILSSNEDTLFVRIHKKGDYHYKKVMLNKVPRGIYSVLYHNNDSIFVFYDRFIVLNMEEKRADFILIDGTGTPQHYYTLDSMPYVRKTYNKHHTLSLYDFCGQVVDNQIILLFTPCKPYITEVGYDTFNPPIAAAYNLKTEKIRMLNIKYPASLTEKKFSSFASPWIEHMHGDNFLVGFKTTPNLYRYNLKEDCMYLIENQQNNTFFNTDSASMKKGVDYLSVYYTIPNRLKDDSYYTRRVVVDYRHGYKCTDVITELMDSNFNHLCYLVGNDKYTTPKNLYGALVADDKAAKRPHKAHLKNRYQRVSSNELLDKVTQKLPKRSHDTLDFRDYLKKMQVPKGSLILIINFKYPCGECLDFLFSTMKENQFSYIQNNIYYIVYDEMSSGLLRAICKRHGITDTTNILEDNSLLQNVYLGGKSMGYGQFFLVDYASLDEKHIAVQPQDFASLKTMLKIAAKQQIEKEKKKTSAQ